MRDRIKRLERIMKDYEQAQHFTVFVLEDGSTFTTTDDPLDFLIKHGAETPQGRIVLYPHPIEGVDPLSLSLYATINEEIQSGTMSQMVRELSSDESNTRFN